jgi:hypothetical protein
VFLEGCWFSFVGLTSGLEATALLVVGLPPAEESAGTGEGRRLLKKDLNLERCPIAFLDFWHVILLVFPSMIGLPLSEGISPDP